MSFERLPERVIFSILWYVDFQDLCAISGVRCKITFNLSVDFEVFLFVFKAPVMGRTLVRLV